MGVCKTGNAIDGMMHSFRNNGFRFAGFFRAIRLSRFHSRKEEGEMEKMESTELNTIGGRIKELRRKKGLTQDALAELLCLSNKSTISMYESGARQLSPTVLTQMAAILGTTTDYLLGMEECVADYDRGGCICQEGPEADQADTDGKGQKGCIGYA